MFVRLALKVVMQNDRDFVAVILPHQCRSVQQPTIA
jgi:hypothetical protein